MAKLVIEIDLTDEQITAMEGGDSLSAACAAVDKILHNDAGDGESVGLGSQAKGRVFRDDAACTADAAPIATWSLVA